MSTSQSLLDLLERSNQAEAAMIREAKKAAPRLDTRPAALDAAEAAKYLGVGRTKFFHDIRPQLPSAIQLGGKVVYRRMWLDKLLDQAERESR